MLTFFFPVKHEKVKRSPRTTAHEQVSKDEHVIKKRQVTTTCNVVEFAVLADFTVYN